MKKVFLGAGKVTTVLRSDDDIIFDHKLLEATDIDSVFKALASIPRGSKVVNCVAKINLEWCEENQEEAHNVNVKAAYNVGLICADLGHHLLHVSSGCIFDGGETNNLYSESSNPTPSVCYTRTKSVADSKLLSIGYDKITIIRPRQLISKVPYLTNMITKFMGIKEGSYIESKNSLTLIEDMGLAIDFLLSKNLYGIYNIANEGFISPFEIATAIEQRFNLGNKISPIAYEAYVSSLKVRRVNTCLDTSKLKKAGLTLRTAHEALDWALKNYGQK